jgi:hypothetical protein
MGSTVKTHVRRTRPMKYENNSSAYYVGLISARRIFKFDPIQMFTPSLAPTGKNEPTPLVNVWCMDDDLTVLIGIDYYGSTNTKATRTDKRNASISPARDEKGRRVLNFKRDRVNDDLYE